ncbi:PREDICTED: uncharacterized protein LOC109164017 isoform X1 [Ipomoea nil]|uniref:uncharacterized protein LOC109164017 isoform X1 n=1 Tax=Ipomoea nil TaxID=35883 RepID=UPI000900B91F|nr:PREDICTED: uncharacterized protein LOC109164017 isoform X1 [Ipomoea nil]XP_019168310.1 PREDICTED: uncharacterized protein LOC109164017 isoform X2 [Ipomoea nil]XP_019168311.1 PREDICTED: uncharacterized protein LOC109164017 isoform X1 [Ipomoea nil]
MVVSVSSWNSYLSGTLQLTTGIKSPTQPFRIHCPNRFSFIEHSSVQLTPKKITSVKIEHTSFVSHDVKCYSYVQRNHQHLRDDDDNNPFFGFLMEPFRVTKTLLSFLAEQPSQLKYIEWPSIQSTLKTASLALVLVVVFIIALSSVDSALCFLLALLSRRAA